MLRKQPSKIYFIPRIQQPPRIDEQSIIVLDESWMAGDVDLAGELDLGVGRQLDFEDDAGLLQFLQEVLVVVDEGDALVAVLEVDWWHAFDERVQVVQHEPFAHTYLQLLLDLVPAWL